MADAVSSNVPDRRALALRADMAQQWPCTGVKPADVGAEKDSSLAGWLPVACQISNP